MIDQTLVNLIKQALSRGQTKDDVYREFLNKRVALAVIEPAYEAAIAEDSKKETQKRTINIIVTIGAILIGAGIFSFIASNWQLISKPGKVSIILAAMLAVYAAGWYLKWKSFAKTGEALMLLGSIIYGSGIFLVAQMFNIRANWPDGFILWMLGTLIMAYAVESYPLYAFGIGLGAVAVVGHPFDIFDFRGNSFLLTSWILLLIATATTFLLGWTIRRRLPKELKDYY